MGTSSSGNGPRPTTPLIPNWIPNTEQLSDNLPEENNDSKEDRQNVTETGEEINPTDSYNEENGTDSNIETLNRYYESRRKFNSFSKNRISGNNSLLESLRSYVKKGSGGSSTLAKRMLPSTSRIARFYTVANAFREQGATETLQQLNLESYTGRPLLDVLSALTDIIFDNSSPYNNIQDDSITKLAYSNTINRIVENEAIELDSLTNENIEVMTAIFIEETIATRVICDVGTSMFKFGERSQEIIEAEETVYQIVSGLVRNQIMPEIIAIQRGQTQNIEKNIQNIYRIAFDCIAGTIQQ